MESFCQKTQKDIHKLHKEIYMKGGPCITAYALLDLLYFAE